MRDPLAQACCRLETPLLQRPLRALWSDVSRRTSPQNAETYCCQDRHHLDWSPASAWAVALTGGVQVTCASLSTKIGIELPSSLVSIWKMVLLVVPPRAPPLEVVG
eukprot:4812303-Pyramimonas_sp.AAC.1